MPNSPLSLVSWTSDEEDEELMDEDLPPIAGPGNETPPPPLPGAAAAEEYDSDETLGDEGNPLVYNDAGEVVGVDAGPEDEPDEIMHGDFLNAYRDGHLAELDHEGYYIRDQAMDIFNQNMNVASTDPAAQNHGMNLEWLNHYTGPNRQRERYDPTEEEPGEIGENHNTLIWPPGPVPAPSNNMDTDPESAFNLNLNPLDPFAGPQQRDYVLGDMAPTHPNAMPDQTPFPGDRYLDGTYTVTHPGTGITSMGQYQTPEAAEEGINRFLEMYVFPRQVVPHLVRYVDEEGTPDGEQMVYHPRGRGLAVYHKMVEGVPHGKGLYFYPSTRVSANHHRGPLRAKYTYAQGVAHGPFTHYDMHGNTVMRGKLDNGLVHGQVEMFPDSPIHRHRKNLFFMNGIPDPANDAADPYDPYFGVEFPGRRHWQTKPSVGLHGTHPNIMQNLMEPKLTREDTEEGGRPSEEDRLDYQWADARANPYSIRWEDFLGGLPETDEEDLLTDDEVDPPEDS